MLSNNDDYLVFGGNMEIELWFKYEKTEEEYR